MDTSGFKFLRNFGNDLPNAFWASVAAKFQSVGTLEILMINGTLQIIESKMIQQNKLCLPRCVLQPTLRSPKDCYSTRYSIESSMF